MTNDSLSCIAVTYSCVRLYGDVVTTNITMQLHRPWDSSSSTMNDQVTTISGGVAEILSMQEYTSLRVTCTWQKAKVKQV